MRSLFAMVGVVALAFGLGCGGGEPGGEAGGFIPDPGDPDDPNPDDPGDPDDPLPSEVTDPLHGLPKGQEQWEALCAKQHNDGVTQAFCNGGAPPSIASIEDVLALLGLSFVPGQYESGVSGNPAFALVHHSTAVTARKVNDINPRAIVFTPALAAFNVTPLVPNPSYEIVAFSRGEPFVELASKDLDSGEPRFYLIRFELACEATGCNNFDMQTPAVESGWTGYSLYDDDDIGNTTLDCKQCHQPGGPSSPKMLRMQELTPYWNHWFFSENPDQSDVVDDYLAAHGQQESYGGIPGQSIAGYVHAQWGRQTYARPQHMQALVTHNGMGSQPSVFDSIAIDQNQSVWDPLYAATVAGQAIPAPYWDVRHVDTSKLATMITAYQNAVSGATPPDQMPDITDVVLDAALPEMSVRPAPGLDGREIMVHLCSHCHNGTLDQNISRATFNVAELDSLPDEVKQEAIARLLLPESSAMHMPPARFHLLSDAERQLVIDELSK